MSEVKKFKPTFENGGFWEYYEDLERQFRNFLEYVPYTDGNETTYSFKLANLILAAGAHIDSAFKEMARWKEFAKHSSLLKKIEEGKATICDYYVFEMEYSLSQKSVIFKRSPEQESIMPFEEYVKVGDKVKTPHWWKTYNGLKHEFSQSFRKANLATTRNALAGAFLLNVIHKPARDRFLSLGTLKVVVKPRSESGHTRATIYEMTPKAFEEWLEQYAKEQKHMSANMETTLFSYDYIQRG